MIAEVGSVQSFELRIVIMGRVFKRAGMTDRDSERQMRGFY